MFFSFYIWEIYSLLMILTLAGKDATSYLWKSRTDDPLTPSRIKRWHRDGVILFLLCFIPLLMVHHWWWLLAAHLLNRVSFFDLEFNRSASLDITYLGGTAAADKFFVKIFGSQGAILKCASFLCLLIALNLLLEFKILQ
jgi:hypothetical protein